MIDARSEQNNMDAESESGEEETEGGEVLREGEEQQQDLVADETIDDVSGDDRDLNDSDNIDMKKYNVMNFALTNARSLPPKIASLTTAIRELSLDFMMVSESWIRNTRDTVRNLGDYKDAENIELICKNRPTRGGGVCVAFNNRSARLKRFPLPTSNFEVVCATGKIKSFSRKIAVIVVYIPPKYDNTQVASFCEYLADAIEKVNRELSLPYICVGGDINRKDITRAFEDFPEIRKLPNIPTRQGAALDLCYTNFGDEIYRFATHPPLTNMDGTPSDHLVVSYDFKIKKKHWFQTTVRTVRTIREKDMDVFRTRLATETWEEMDGKTSTEMVEIFDRKTKAHYDHVFPAREVKTRSSDLPWVTKRLKRAIRRKKRKYRTMGKSKEWLEMARVLERDINDNRVRHVGKVKKKALQDGGRAYHQTMALLTNDKPKPRWTPCDLFPELNEKETAERCADFFNGISSEFDQIDAPVPPMDMVDPPLAYQISGRLRVCKKPRSEMDLDPKVVTHCCDVLAMPLQKIYAEVFRTCSWPKQWKNETVTIIPKNAAPASLSETRNLSCTPLYSKVLESFLLEKLREEVTLNDTQFGGIKGLGVDHFLVETWDEILRAVDSGGKATNLMSIDFQKAFNRMDHAVCMDRLTRKGAGAHLVQLVGAFLHRRTMTVKAGNEKSDPRFVNGGAPQGSILAPFLFCVTSEILAETVMDTSMENLYGESTAGGATSPPTSPEAEMSHEEQDTSGEEWAAVEAEFNFFRRRKHNPLNDTVHSEAPAGEEDGNDEVPRPSVKAYIDDFNIIEVVDTSRAARHITTHKTKLSIHVKRSEKIFENINNRAADINMVVNAQKTQMLCIDANPNCETRTFMKPGTEHINSRPELKILGFHFGEKPTCHNQIEFLLNKCRSRLWSLRKMVSYGLSEEDLAKYYEVNLRPVLEYTQCTYHSMLTRTQAGKLEQTQSRALKIIYGTGRGSYSVLREVAKIDTLEKRRTDAFERFAVKCSKNPLINFKWCPLNPEPQYPLRQRRRYLEENARTQKLYDSPLFALRRTLNRLG